MRRGGKVLILLGITLGILTAAGTFFVVSTTETQTQGTPMRSVVIAQQNIPAKAEIQPDAVGRADWPETYLPAGAYEKTSDVAGKLTLGPIYQGQIILQPMVVSKSQVNERRSNASFLVPDGKVAVAYPLSPLSSVANALQSGDYVDLLLTLPPMAKSGTATAPSGSNEGLPTTQLMLQDVLVLQVGPWTTTSDTKNAPVADMATFAIDRQDALAVKSAREQGTIELALRRAGDHKVATTEPVTIQYLNKRFNFALVPVTGK